MAIHIAALLDKAQVIHRLPSDYKLALVMGISHSSLTSYRQGKTMPDARVIAKLCDLTGDDAGVLLAEIEAERAKTDEARALWRQVAARLSSAVHAAIFAVLFGGSLWGGFSNDAQAADRPFLKLQPLYIVECARAVFTRLFRRLAPAVCRYGRGLFSGGNHVQSAASTASA